MKKIICFDWDGTLARKEIVEKAALIRFEILNVEKGLDYIKKAIKTNEHYKVNKQAISKKTGITDERELTKIMTNLFQYCYLILANQSKDKIFFKDIIKVIKEIKNKYKLTFAIATTLRKDIVANIIKILNLQNLFEIVEGNNPELDFNKEDLVKKISKQGNIILMIGDKEEDILAGKSVKSKTALSTWGHHTGTEKKLADFTLKQPKDLLKITSKII